MMNHPRHQVKNNVLGEQSKWYHFSNMRAVSSASAAGRCSATAIRRSSNSRLVTLHSRVCFFGATSLRPQFHHPDPFSEFFPRMTSPIKGWQKLV